MYLLQLRVLSLILWLALFFNIERLNVGSIDTINLPSPVYIVGLIAVLLGFTERLRRRRLGVLLAICTVLFAVTLLLTPGPDMGGNHTYITLTGLSTVLVAAALARQVARDYDEFRKAVEMVSMAGGNRRLPRLDEIQNQVAREMDHSLRTQRPLSVVVMRLEGARLSTIINAYVAEIQRSLAERYALAAIAHTLNRYLRKTNMVVADPAPGSLLIIAPETNDEQVQVLAGRVNKVIRDSFELELQLSTATLPNDALTFEDLRHVAASKLGAPADLPAVAAPAPLQREAVGAEQ